MKVIIAENYRTSKNIAVIENNGKTYTITFDELQKSFRNEIVDISTAKYTNTVINELENAVSVTICCEERSYIFRYKLDEEKIRGSASYPGFTCGIIFDQQLLAFAEEDAGDGIFNIVKIEAELGTSDSSLEYTSFYRYGRSNNPDDYKITCENGIFDFEINNVEKKEDSELDFSCFEYWTEGFSTAETMPSPESVFLHTGITRASASNSEAFTICQSPKFIAGYIKYVILPKIISELVISDEEVAKGLEKLTGTKLPDFPQMRQMPGTAFNVAQALNCDKYNLLGTIGKIEQQCDKVLFCVKERKLNKLVNELVSHFNKSFGNKLISKTGYNFAFKVLCGVSELSSFLNDKSASQQIDAVLGKNQWTEEESLSVKELLEKLTTEN